MCACDGGDRNARVWLSAAATLMTVSPADGVAFNARYMLFSYQKQAEQK